MTGMNFPPDLALDVAVKSTNKLHLEKRFVPTVNIQTYSCVHTATKRHAVSDNNTTAAGSQCSNTSLVLSKPPLGLLGGGRGAAFGDAGTTAGALLVAAADGAAALAIDSVAESMCSSAGSASTG